MSLIMTIVIIKNSLKTIKEIYSMLIYRSNNI